MMPRTGKRMLMTMTATGVAYVFGMAIYKNKQVAYLNNIEERKAEE